MVSFLPPCLVQDVGTLDLASQRMSVEKRGLGTLFINTLILTLRLRTYERKGLEVNSEAKGRHELPPLPVPRAVF